MRDEDKTPAGLARLRVGLGALLALSFVLALFWGGRHPAAGSLVAAPWDKALHFGAFFVLSLCVHAATRSRAWLVIVAPAVGLLDEWHQSFLPGRSAGWGDWWADVAGMGAALVVVLVWQGRAARRRG